LHIDTTSNNEITVLVIGKFATIYVTIREKLGFSAEKTGINPPHCLHPKNACNTTLTIIEM
jgi:hypothetical protein